jgi:hypothetical protein
MRNKGDHDDAKQPTKEHRCEEAGNAGDLCRQTAFTETDEQEIEALKKKAVEAKRKAVRTGRKAARASVKADRAEQAALKGGVKLTDKDKDK